MKQKKKRNLGCLYVAAGVSVAVSVILEGINYYDNIRLDENTNTGEIFYPTLPLDSPWFEFRDVENWSISKDPTTGTCVVTIQYKNPQGKSQTFVTDTNQSFEGCLGPGLDERFIPTAGIDLSVSAAGEISISDAKGEYR